MKQLIFLFSTLIILSACGGGGVQGTDNLASEMDSISYSIGHFFAGQVTELGLDLNAEELGKGLIDVNEDKAVVSLEEGAIIMGNFQQALQIRKGAPFTEEDPATFSVDTVCYVIGADFARNMKEFDLVFNGAAFLQGALDKKADAESMVGGKEDDLMQQLTLKLQEKQMAMAAEQQAEAAKLAEVYIAEGEAFITEKAAEAGVKSTPSGLHYKVIQAGSGPSPTATSQVTVHYHGTLIDGTVFDSSVDRGEPANFGLNQVIPGWTEGLQLMSPGAKYQFYIPQDLGYGINTPPDIPPGSTLIFDVELISIDQ